jgi:hypothetical protein
MSRANIRKLTFIMPLISLFVSAFIVGHQYWRQESLKREALWTRQEIQRIQKENPGLFLPKEECDDPNHDHSEQHKQ